MRHVEAATRWALVHPHPRFDEALAAFDAGDLAKLRTMLRANPSLVHARGCLQPPLGYFTGAMLLHHVAGNPYRCPLPADIVEIARMLIESGADVNAETLAPQRGTATIGLIVTSAHASEVGVTGPLMDLLLAHGAKLDLQSDDCLSGPLNNHAHRAAERMIELGAPVDVLAAAALGRMDLLRACFDTHGGPRRRPRRSGRTLSSRDAIGLAALSAYVNQRTEAVDFLLEKDGNWNMIGVNNGTALHRATSGGDLDMVKRLLARGADRNDRNNPFRATPFSWADHAHQDEVFDWMRTNCAIDLHDAVCFDLPDQVRARLDEDPRSVDRAIDQWDVPRSTALHWAARTTRPHLVSLLLQRGANPNLLAGDGHTPLDMAEKTAAAEVTALLTAHGGRRAADL